MAKLKESYSDPVRVSDSPTYAIHSYGNGAAYKFVHKPSNTSVFFQGDDATQFRDEWEGAEKAWPNKSSEQIHHHLWHGLDYGTIAQDQHMKEETTLLERLYGRGETRPFDGLTTDQSSLRDKETQDARAHMQRAGVKNTAFMSDQEVRDRYFSKPKTHWDTEEVRHTTGNEYRYYSMHPANAEDLIKDLRKSGHKFQINTKTTHASAHGIKIGGSYSYDNDRHDVRAHPRLEIAVKAPAAFHDRMLEKHQQYLVFEGKSWKNYILEALDSVTVAGVDGIPRTMPVKNEDDQVENNDAAVYNGQLPDPTDNLDKIFDGETQARLEAIYGPNWHQLVSQSMASIPRLQPNNREVNESFLNENLAAALNYMNTVEHGNSKPRTKSTIAYYNGVEQLYGKEVAKEAMRKADSGNHQGAIDYVRGVAVKADNPKTVEMAAGGTPNYGRLNDGPYSQLHAMHLNKGR